MYHSFWPLSTFSILKKINVDQQISIFEWFLKDVTLTGVTNAVININCDEWSQIELNWITGQWGDPVLVAVATVRCVTGALAGCPLFRHVPGHHQQICSMRGKRKPAENHLKPREKEVGPVRGGKNTHTHTRALTEGHCVPALHEWSFLWVRVCVCVCVWSHTSANYAAVADHWIIHTYEHNVSNENASVCVLLYICESGPSKGFPGLSLFMFRETEREGQPMRASFHMSQ